MRVRRYLLNKVEEALSDVLKDPHWIIKKGRFYHLQCVRTGVIFESRYSNLAEIVERYDLYVGE